MTYTGVVDIGGRMITFAKPTDGQLEMLARIQRTLSRGTDDAPGEFWSKQIDRLGTLLDSLMSEADLEIVETMLLTGKISHVDILKGLFYAIEQGREDEPTPAPTTGPVASPKRARRG
jgi:hypothetical protein